MVTSQQIQQQRTRFQQSQEQLRGLKSRLPETRTQKALRDKGGIASLKERRITEQKKSKISEAQQQLQQQEKQFEQEIKPFTKEGQAEAQRILREKEQQLRVSAGKAETIEDKRELRYRADAVAKLRNVKDKEAVAYLVLKGDFNETIRDIGVKIQLSKTRSYIDPQIVKEYTSQGYDINTARGLAEESIRRGMSLSGAEAREVASRGFTRANIPIEFNIPIPQKEIDIQVKQYRDAGFTKAEAQRLTQRSYQQGYTPDVKPTPLEKFYTTGVEPIYESIPGLIPKPIRDISTPKTQVTILEPSTTQTKPLTTFTVPEISVGQATKETAKVGSYFIPYVGTGLIAVESGALASSLARDPSSIPQRPLEVLGTTLGLGFVGFRALSGASRSIKALTTPRLIRTESLLAKAGEVKLTTEGVKGTQYLTFRDIYKPRIGKQTSRLRDEVLDYEATIKQSEPLKFKDIFGVESEGRFIRGAVKGKTRSGQLVTGEFATPIKISKTTTYTEIPKELIGLYAKKQPITKITSLSEAPLAIFETPSFSGRAISRFTVRGIGKTRQAKRTTRTIGTQLFGGQVDDLGFGTSISSTYFPRVRTRFNEFGRLYSKSQLKELKTSEELFVAPSEKALARIKERGQLPFYDQILEVSIPQTVTPLIKPAQQTTKKAIESSLGFKTAPTTSLSAREIFAPQRPRFIGEDDFVTQTGKMDLSLGARTDIRSRVDTSPRFDILQRVRQRLNQQQQPLTGLGTIQNNLFRSETKPNVRTGFRQANKLSAQQRQQLINQVTLQTRTTVTPKPTNLKLPTPILDLPSKDKLLKTERENRKRLLKAYELLVKRGGEFESLGLFPRGKALRRGSQETLRTLSATFKIRPTERLTSERDILFSPSRELFRDFKIQRGRRVPITDTFIQRRGKRLTTGFERRAIQKARRRKR